MIFLTTGVSKKSSGGSQVTNEQLMSQMNEIDNKIKEMTDKLERTITSVKNIDIKAKALSVINQIAPVTSSIGTLWYQTLNFKERMRREILQLCDKQSEENEEMQVESAKTCDLQLLKRQVAHRKLRLTKEMLSSN